MRLSRIFADRRQLETDLIRAARLRQSILKQAFEGRLVPQDPNDEPAATLLERIRVTPQNITASGKSARPTRKRPKQSAIQR